MVQRRQLTFEVDDGGGAFYGPKIDIKIMDALDREWQCTTIQFDFNLPDKFDMAYIGEDGKHHRPYMIHRALLGSMERFFAVLLEHCGGNYPLWLAPMQARVVPVKNAHIEYARTVAARLAARDLRADVDESNRPMGAKVRDGKLEKIPYTLVVGDKEAAGQTVAVRCRDGRQMAAVPLEECIAHLCEERDTRALNSVWAAATTT